MKKLIIALIICVILSSCSDFTSNDTFLQEIEKDVQNQQEKQYNTVFNIVGQNENTTVGIEIYKPDFFESSLNGDPVLIPSGNYVFSIALFSGNTFPYDSILYETEIDYYHDGMYGELNIIIEDNQIVNIF